MESELKLLWASPSSILERWVFNVQDWTILLRKSPVQILRMQQLPLPPAPTLKVCSNVVFRAAWATACVVLHHKLVSHVVQESPQAWPQYTSQMWPQSKAQSRL